MHDLTVGMPLCNEGKYLTDSIESLIKNYDYIDRIILSDNCSDDETSTIGKKYATKYDKVEYVRQSHRLGLWDSWRVPLNLATTKYFMWMCGHDIISDNFMKEMLQKLNQFPDAVAGLSMVYMFYNDITNQRVHLDPLFSMATSEDVIQRITAVLNNWHHAILLNQIIKTDVLKEMPRMDQVASDQTLSFYIVLKGRCVYSTEANYFYRENIRNNESFIERQKRYKSWGLEFNDINPLGYLPKRFMDMCEKENITFKNNRLSDMITQLCRITRDADFNDADFILRHKRGAMLSKLKLSGKNIIIFGTGKEAESIYHAIREDIKIYAFADNSPIRQQQKYMGLDVWSPMQLEKEKGNLYVIIAMSSFYREISNQLSNIGMNTVIGVKSTHGMNCAALLFMMHVQNLMFLTNCN